MKFLDFIIAEDIRFETGNKFSVMGIYNEEITLNLPDDTQWPVPFRFGVYIRLELEDSDHIPNRFVLNVDHNNTNIATMTGNIQIKKSVRIISLPLVLFPFPLQGYGNIRFNFEIYDKDNLLSSGIHEIEVVAHEQQN
ncbi:MAG: hypothetical protein ACR65O_09720 [Methylomicrobium sp.]